jgi:hypothetical protein
MYKWIIYFIIKDSSYLHCNVDILSSDIYTEGYCVMSNLILHKEKDRIYKDPLNFIDTIDACKHIVLYCEN